jgi:FMN phosphatase YigB (HAD superfamily)
MKREKLVLDHDGTLTDVVKNYGLYREEYGRIFTTLTGTEPERLQELMEAARSKIVTDPSRGWLNNGVVVAPATADPYILHLTIFQEICDGLGMSVESRDNVLNECFKRAYATTPTTFREEIGTFLNNVQGRYDTFVVTNAATDHVRNGLERIGFSNIPVIGDARKYVVDQSWDGVPLLVQPDGFPRPVMLRRKDYSEVLAGIGASPEDTTVVGDIYELDLALPDHLEMKIVQIVNGGLTPEHEIDYMRAHPRGSLVEGLEGVQDVLARS